MTRREFVLLLTAAANEQSRSLIRQLYARGPHRGERSAKLAPPPTVAPDKSTKIRRKGRAVATKNG